MLAGESPSSLFVGKREAEEGVHESVRGGDEVGAHAMVSDEEEAVVATGLADEAGGFGGGGGVAGEESGEVDEGDGELRAGGGRELRAGKTKTLG